MKVAVIEAGFKSWVAIWKVYCLLLVLYVAAQGASVLIVHCHIEGCLADKVNVFFFFFFCGVQ
jgi:hypothetical protein